MKKLNEFLHGFKHLIKKIFFIRLKTDKYHACENNGLGLNEIDMEALMAAEEYVSCYKITTRWQTL